MTLHELFSQAGDETESWCLFLDTSSHEGQILAFNSQFQILHSSTWGKEARHDETLNPEFEKIKSKLSLQKLKALITVQGPGSFTGLRVSATFVKTLSFALGGVPIYGISSFLIPAYSIINRGLVEKGESFGVQVPSIQGMTFQSDFIFKEESNCYFEEIDTSSAKIRTQPQKNIQFYLKPRLKDQTPVPDNFHEDTVSCLKSLDLFRPYTTKGSYLDFYPLFLRRSEAEEKFNYEQKK